MDNFYFNKICPSCYSSGKKVQQITLEDHATDEGDRFLCPGCGGVWKCCDTCGGEGGYDEPDPNCRGCLGFDYDWGHCAGACASEVQCRDCGGDGLVVDEDYEYPEGTVAPSYKPDLEPSEPDYESMAADRADARRGRDIEF